MRPTDSHDGVRRSDRSIQKKRKVLIITEGQRTEKNYFTALKQKLTEYQDSCLVEVIVLQRYITQDGISDPERIIELTSDYIRMLKTGEYSSKLLTGRIVDSLIADHAKYKSRKNDVEHKLEMVLKDENLVGWDCIVKEPDRAIDACIRYLESEYGIRELELEDDYVVYDEEIDKICLVVDRDGGQRGRSKEKYERFIKSCHDHNYFPYVTNPRFELWILLHYNISRIVDELKDPKRCNDCIKREMNRLKIGKKSRFDQIMDSIELAMENSEMFSHDLEELEAEVGTNISDLILDITPHDDTA